ncbi:hypothetical protein [Promicromonospora sp. NPDC023805]|uniref:hypothetical protein n=1 Tax=Promicromonospora sp. NPDC023805 TaxID=3154696 RepID=UPI0033ED4DB7
MELVESLQLLAERASERAAAFATLSRAWRAVLISLGTGTVMFATAEPERQTAPARVSFLTGGILLSTALLFLTLHLLVG